jgi:hypothetical protein
MIKTVVKLILVMLLIVSVEPFIIKLIKGIVQVKKDVIHHIVQKIFPKPPNPTNPTYTVTPEVPPEPTYRQVTPEIKPPIPTNPTNPVTPEVPPKPT